MKRIFLGLAVLILTPVVCLAVQTAQVRMYSLSLRFHTSTDQSGAFSIELSTITNSNNGELGPYFYFFDPGFTHSAYLDLSDVLDDHMYGAMDLSVPQSGDADVDGFPDFFEVSQPASGVTSGKYRIPGFGNGNVSASWARSMGSSLGSCVLTLKNNTYGNLVFTASFDILEYKGPLVYVPGSNTVTGTLNLVQTGNPANTLTGLVAFAKSSTNRFNQLTLQPGALTNSYGDALNFFMETYRRDAPWPTNYYGAFEFLDGDLNTAEEDYWSWELTIDDLNDADHDGIPDFSDDPALVTPPRAPVLTLRLGTSNLWLTINGDTNHVHLIQEIGALGSTNWETVLSTNVTMDPTTVSLPLSGSSPKFWRVLAQ